MPGNLRCGPVAPVSQHERTEIADGGRPRQQPPRPGRDFAICPATGDLEEMISGAMMLRHFGAAEAADAVEHAIAAILAKAKVRTPDIGGSSSTQELGEAIAKQVSVS